MKRRAKAEKRETRQPDLPREFRRAVREHNHSAVLASLLSLGGSILIWPFLYFLASWFWLLALTVLVGPYEQVPQDFPQHFAVVALCGGPVLLLLDRLMNTACASFLERHDVARWLLELALAPYKIFLGIFGNLEALLLVHRREMIEAVRFLRLLDDLHHLETRRIAVELPNARRREKVLHLISMLDLIRYQQLHGQLYIFLRNPPRVRNLIYAKVRFKHSNLRRAQARQSGQRPPGKPPRLRLRA